jgi:vitamin B12 transporter
MFKSLFLFTAACVCSSVAHAQDAAGEAALDEIIRQQGDALPQTENLLDTVASQETPEITVTATGLPISIANTGQAVTLIGLEEIETVQGPDIARVLRRSPGVTTNRNGPVGAFTSVNVRGAPGDQLLVLIDGVPVRDPAAPSGGFDFGNLQLGTVERIDLLRGSNSVIWGSDAIAGVMEVTTRRRTGIAGSVEYGARDTLFANTAAGLERGSAFGGLSASYLRTDGFSAAAGGAEADGFEQVSVAGNASVDLTPALELFVQGRYAEGTLAIDGFPAPAFALVDTNEEQRTEQLSGAIGANYYGTDLTLRLAYSLADTTRDNFASSAAGEPSFASDGHAERLILRGEYRLLGGLSLAFGGEREWTDYRTSFGGQSSGGAETAIAGAYVQAGWVLGRLAAHAGVRIDDHQRFGSEWSFGGDVSYQLAGDWRVRASVGEGFKAPSLFQLFSDFGNEDLRPERSTSYDIGVEHGRRDAPFFASLTGWRRNTSDLIEFASCGSFSPSVCDRRPFGTYRNVGEARAQGMEFEAAVRPLADLSLGAVYTLTDTENRSKGDANFGNTLARIPRHALTAYADWQVIGGLTLGGDVRLVGDSFDDAGNRVRLDGFALVDLRASLPLADRLEVFGRIENLFDAEYQTVAGYGNAGRGAFIGVRVRR